MCNMYDICAYTSIFEYFLISDMQKLRVDCFFDRFQLIRYAFASPIHHCFVVFCVSDTLGPTVGRTSKQKAKYGYPWIAMDIAIHPWISTLKSCSTRMFPCLTIEPTL